MKWEKMDVCIFCCKCCFCSCSVFIRWVAITGHPMSLQGLVPSTGLCSVFNRPWESHWSTMEDDQHLLWGPTHQLFLSPGPHCHLRLESSVRGCALPQRTAWCSHPKTQNSLWVHRMKTTQKSKGLRYTLGKEKLASETWLYTFIQISSALCRTHVDEGILVADTQVVQEPEGIFSLFGWPITNMDRSTVRGAQYFPHEG